MKNIFKLMIPCMAFAFSLTSCDKTMDDKASIDAQYERATNATVSLNSATALDFQTIVAQGSITNEAEVIEAGIQLCSDTEFKNNVKSYYGSTVEVSFNDTIPGLAEQTTYYVRAYAMTRTAGLIVTEPQSVTTPKAPIFPLDGTYTVTEWDVEDDYVTWTPAAETYEMTITFDEADPTIVNITNIWGGGMTVQGQYDAETGIITVPNMQVIYVHNTYGDVWLRGIDLDEGVYTDCVYFQFTALGGKMVSTSMAAQCAAGDFGYFYLTMEHQ
jgi:hypothetical protein